MPNFFVQKTLDKQAIFEVSTLPVQEENGHGPPYTTEMRHSLDSDEETAAGSELEAPLISEKLEVQHTRHHIPQFFSLSSSPKVAPWRVPPLRRIAQTIANGIIPSFLKTSGPSGSAKSAGANSIAALDGLRGLACLFVFNEHLTFNIDTSFLYGYGVEDRRSIVQWPFVRIFWSGFSMVAIFYVISGYVLSYRPLKQIRAKDMAGFQATLTSSVVRRAMRLYLPTTTAVLICGLLVFVGAFTYANEVIYTDDNYLGLHEGPPPILEGFFVQMADALRSALRMLNVWQWSDDVSADDYDRHLWTIVVEFRSSMVLFLLLLGVSRMKQACRLLTELGFIMFCIATERTDVLLFVSGMFIAEVDLIHHSSNQQPFPKQSIRLPNARITWLLLFVAGIFLSSTPTLGASNTPGYRTLSTLSPWSDSAVFLRSIGAIFIVWSTANSQLLKPIFTNSFALYLGKISYALYLVHGNVLKSLGYASMPLVFSITNDGTKVGITTGRLVMSWMLCVLITVPVTFWLSDLFWRGVDMPCVRFARWVEAKISEDFEDDDKLRLVR